MRTLDAGLGFFLVMISASLCCCRAPGCRLTASRSSAFCHDHVPVFYRNQDDMQEIPKEIVTREEARGMKTDLLGKFENHGRSFRLFEADPDANKRRSSFEGPIGIGNLLPFSPPTDATKKHHYEIPLAGDRNLLRRHGLRRRAGKEKLLTHVIHVSGRNLFAKQAVL